MSWSDGSWRVSMADGGENVQLRQGDRLVLVRPEAIAAIECHPMGGAEHGFDGTIVLSGGREFFVPEGGGLGDVMHRLFGPR